MLKSPAGIVRVIPSLTVDDLVGFSPQFFWVYISLWIYVFLPAAFLNSYREIKTLILGLGGICIVGLLLFYVFPTRVNVMEEVFITEQAKAYTMLRKIDAAGNSFPSLHVATAVYAAIWVDDLLAQIRAPQILRLISLLWGGAIVYSTMAIKQHVFIDVLGGIVLAVVFIVSFRLRNIIEPNGVFKGID